MYQDIVYFLAKQKGENPGRANIEVFVEKLFENSRNQGSWFIYTFGFFIFSGLILWVFFCFKYFSKFWKTTTKNEEMEKKKEFENIIHPEIELEKKNNLQINNIFNADFWGTQDKLCKQLNCIIKIKSTILTKYLHLYLYSFIFCHFSIFIVNELKCDINRIKWGKEYRIEESQNHGSTTEMCISQRSKMIKN